MYNKYFKVVNFLESLTNMPSATSFRLKEKGDKSVFIKRLKFLLKLLGSPEKKLSYIHITGTSGKGSLVAIVSSILNKAGEKTGSFYSPHITEVTERIKVGDKLISPSEFVDIFESIKPALDKCAKESPHGVPSYFETILAIAFLYFKKKKCKYVVLEAGLGGRFDATNVIEKSEISVITNVGLDHVEILGDTKQKIAFDKAGIIKSKSRFITGEKSKKISDIFRKICSSKKTEFNNIKFNFKIIKNTINGTEFKYKNEIYKIKLLGKHQIENAILGIEVSEMLAIDSFAIKDGLANSVLPCRLEVIKKNPLIIIDGAHNKDKMKTTATFIKDIEYRKLHLVIGVANNKDMKEIFKRIIPLSSNIYLTRFLITQRKTYELKEMKNMVEKYKNKEVEVFIDPKDALDLALKNAGKNDLVLITGSFFLAGELRKKWYSSEYILKNRKIV